MVTSQAYFQCKNIKTTDFDKVVEKLQSSWDTLAFHVPIHNSFILVRNFLSYKSFPWNFRHSLFGKLVFSGAGKGKLTEFPIASKSSISLAAFRRISAT